MGAIPVSPEVQVLTGTVTFNAVGQLKAIKDEPFLVRGIQLEVSSGGNVKAGYGGGSARLFALPFQLWPVDGRFYDLNKLIVEAIDDASDSVTWIATR